MPIYAACNDHRKQVTGLCHAKTHWMLAVLGGASPTPHPDTVRLEKLAKDLNEYRKCAHGRKITNESGASRLYNWWIDIPTNITADDLRAYIDGLEG